MSVKRRHPYTQLPFPTFFGLLLTVHLSSVSLTAHTAGPLLFDRSAICVVLFKTAHQDLEQCSLASSSVGMDWVHWRWHRATPQYAHTRMQGVARDRFHFSGSTPNAGTNPTSAYLKAKLESSPGEGEYVSLSSPVSSSGSGADG